MKLRKVADCPNCKRVRRRVAKLEAQLRAALAHIAELESRNTRLAEQLAKAHKDSSTSSKPPSSDIVKPPKPARKRGKKRKRGGQPGHKRHERLGFARPTAWRLAAA